MKVFQVAATMLVITYAILLGGCGQETTKTPVALTSGQAGVPVQVSQRFVVVRQQVFNDDLAYGGERGVYVITDTKTGIEYFGVSGVGISELGTHRSGKSSVSDER